MDFIAGFIDKFIWSYVFFIIASFIFSIGNRKIDEEFWRSKEENTGKIQAKV
jgi:hypothetical protein